jgi:RinA family phage transcriptional activator
MKATATKKGVFNRVEAILYCYPRMKKEIQMIRESIMFDKEEIDENVGGGRPSLPGKPTERIATRLATDKDLEKLERTVKAVEEVYHSLPDEYKRLIQLRYWTSRKYRWERKMTWERIAEQLHVSQPTVYLWRREIIKAIAERLEEEGA